jgi:hypothetical protein
LLSFAFFYLRLFFRIETLQGLTADSNKKIPAPRLGCIQHLEIVSLLPGQDAEWVRSTGLSSEMKSLRHDDADEQTCLSAVRESAKKVFERVAEYIGQVHPDDYLASLFKNHSKCEQLVNTLLGPANFKNDGGQGTLF